ncbi:MAG: TIM barrel protein [Saprospiraceae bacterium]
MNRRNFLGKSTLGLGAAVGWSQLPISLFANSYSKFTDLPLGFQTYPIRDMLAKDFAGTLKTMSGFGYQLTELCSPAGYAQGGFGFLTNMKTAEIKNIIQDAGLRCPSCHFTKTEFTPEKLDQSIEFAQQLGLSQMICSTFWLPKTATLSDYHADVDKLNKAAEKIKSAGMATGFHNHSMEFVILEDHLIYDALMDRFDPNLIKMQFQTEVINLGFKASTYFNKYPGRFISAHLSDWTADKKESAVGQGIIDWKEFFDTAKTGGVKNFFVEMKFDKYKDSSGYIHAM